MESPLQPFDLAQLHRSIAEARSDRGLTWAEVSRQVGVSTTTIQRFSKASDAEADGVLLLIRWLGVAPEHFVTESRAEGVLLPSSGDRFVRVDMALVAALPTWNSKLAGSRTTIQRLVTAAQEAATPVASLTRLSQV